MNPGPVIDARRLALQADVRRLAETLARPGYARDPAAARAAIEALARGDLLKLCVPAAYGGAASGVEALSLVVVREELARASGFHDAMFAVQGLSAHPIATAGNAETRQRWLPALGSGTAIGAFAATEPEAGSDLAAIKTVAKRDAQGYVIDGLKSYISNAGVADVYVVFARVPDASQESIAAFVVPGDAPGIEVTPIELMAAHVMGSVRLRDVRVAESARLSGDGLALCLSTLRVFRPTVGAAACGMAARALDEATQRVKVRQQFGKVLSAQQAIRFQLAEMATRLEAARLMVHRAAWLEDQGGPEGERIQASSMAKLFATDAAQDIVDAALQLHGAAGLVRGSVVEALYREVRSLRIYEGASEIQKLIIARELLGDQGR